MTAAAPLSRGDKLTRRLSASLEHGVIEITVFTKEGGPLTKRIWLNEDGALKSDGSQCIMPTGVARRFRFERMQNLAAHIGGLQSDQAIAAGSLRADLPDRVGVVTKRKLNGANHPGIIARTQDYLIFPPGEAALALVDFDAKGMPPAATARIKEKGGFWSALVSIMPALAAVARVERSSTSAGLFDSRTGRDFPGSGGMHVYLLISDGADTERFLKALHARCWLAGLGWMMVGASGQLLERSIVDRVVGSPERLAFEGPPVLLPPLAQDKASRHPSAFEGEALDTIVDCPPLTIIEIARLKELRAKERHRLVGESAKAREAFVDREGHRLADRTGMDLRRARKTIERQCEGVLLPDVELPFDDPELEGKTGADVLADPASFEGETLADPLEGVEYGRCKARIMRRADGSVWIHSFAHGRTTYELRLDYAAVRAVLERTPKDDLPDAFARTWAPMRRSASNTLRLRDPLLAHARSQPR